MSRGFALFSMLAANTFDALDDEGRPTLAVMTVTGRSATMFVMVAGISLAFITGGRNRVQGLARRAAARGLAVRALVIATIGLAIGYGAQDESARASPSAGSTCPPPGWPPACWVAGWCWPLPPGSGRR